MSLPLCLLCAACTNSGGTGGAGDMAASAPDLTAAGADLATAAPDLLTPGQPTGSACARDGECAPGVSKNQPAKCVQKDNAMLVWPMGYCTTPCKVSLNDMNSGVNPDCPGGNGICESDTGGDTGHCRFVCMMSKECRAGYSCFAVDVANGCEPTSMSECDPKKPGVCGLPMPIGDGGMDYGRTCASAGPDNDVGYCYPGCNPFTVMGCNVADPNNADCHVSALTGEGECDAPNDMPAKAGEMCSFDDDCQPGYGCSAGGKCWKYCHDDGKTVEAQCGKMGATCTKLPMSPVPASKVGICSISN